MTVQTQQARRRYPRATLRGTVQVNIPGKRVTGELMTLSRGGCFVVGVPKLRVGAEYRTFLILSGVSNPIELIGKVIYNLPAMDGHEAGAGIAFVRIAETDETRIEDVVKRSGELYRKLLDAVTDATEMTDEIEQLCHEAGLPEGMKLSELRWHVVRSVSQFRS